MGHFRQIGHENFVGNGLAQNHRQLEITILKLLAGQHTAHRHHLRILVRHLYTNGSFTGYRRDDPYPQGRQTQGDVVFQVFDLGDFHSRSGHDFVQGYGWTHTGLDTRDANFIIFQRLDNHILAPLNLFHVDFLLFGVVFLQQIQGRKYVFTQFLGGVIYRIDAHMLHGIVASILIHRLIGFIGHHFHLKIFVAQ